MRKNIHISPEIQLEVVQGRIIGANVKANLGSVFKKNTEFYVHDGEGPDISISQRTKNITFADDQLATVVSLVGNLRWDLFHFNHHTGRLDWKCGPIVAAYHAHEKKRELPFTLLSLLFMASYFVVTTDWPSIAEIRQEPVAVLPYLLRYVGVFFASIIISQALTCLVYFPALYKLASRIDKELSKISLDFPDFDSACRSQINPSTNDYANAAICTIILSVVIFFASKAYVSLVGPPPDRTAKTIFLISLLPALGSLTYSIAGILTTFSRDRRAWIALILGVAFLILAIAIR